MSDAKLLKRQQRIESMNKAIAKGFCPNCDLKLRDNWQHGGKYCPKCSWEVKNGK